jgi:hypothetical protein
MVKTGGVPPLSITLYDLSQYLKENANDELIVATRGMLHHNIPLLTNEKIWPLNVEKLNKEILIDKITKHMEKNKKIFIIEATSGNPHKVSLNEIQKIVSKNKKIFRLDKEFYNKAGIKTYSVYIIE